MQQIIKMLFWYAEPGHLGQCVGRFCEQMRLPLKVRHDLVALVNLRRRRRPLHQRQQSDKQKPAKNIAMKLKTWTVDLTRGAFKSVCELDTSCLRTHKLVLCILNFLADYHLVLLDCCSIWYCPLVRRALVEAIYFFFTWILKRSWRFQLFVPCRSFEATVRPKRTNSFDEWLSYTLV